MLNYLSKYLRSKCLLKAIWFQLDKFNCLDSEQFAYFDLT